MKNLIMFLILLGPMAAWAKDDALTRYDAIVNEMKLLQIRYPHLAEIVTLGENDQGVNILGLRIERPETLEGKVGHLLVGTHHGNEHHAPLLSLSFAGKMLEIFEEGPSSFRGNLSSGVYYIFPVLNISGYNSNHRYEKDAAGRWHDPNRDYPDICVDNVYFKLRSTALIAQFIDVNNIISAVTVHGYLGTFTYPWGFYTKDPQTPDHHLYDSILSYAAKANGYKTGTHKEIIYPASGTFEDWAYQEYGVWVALLEIDYSYDEEADVEALLRFFSSVPQKRSLDHAHYGQCSEIAMRDTQQRFEIFNIGRP